MDIHDPLFGPLLGIAIGVAIIAIIRLRDRVKDRHQAEASASHSDQQTPAAESNLRQQLLGKCAEVSKAIGQENLKRLAWEIGFRPQADVVGVKAFADYLCEAVGPEEGLEYLQLGLYRMAPGSRRAVEQANG